MGMFGIISEDTRKSYQKATGQENADVIALVSGIGGTAAGAFIASRFGDGITPKFIGGIVGMTVFATVIPQIAQEMKKSVDEKAKSTSETSVETTDAKKTGQGSMDTKFAMLSGSTKSNVSAERTTTADADPDITD